MTMTRVVKRMLGATLVTATAVAGAVLPATPSYAAMPFFQAPFPCGETWGGNTRNDGHGYAIDFNWGSGTDDKGKPVVAAASGTVTGSGVYSDGVSYVIIDHGGGWTTRYLHMEVASQVPTGTKVAAGAQIGRVSDVGSPGQYHLHFEERYNGVKQPAYFNGVPFTYVYYPDRTHITSRNCGATVPRQEVGRI